MSAFIKYVRPSTGETKFVNVNVISEATFNEVDQNLDITVGDPNGHCTSCVLSGREALDALAIINSCARPKKT